ncbi:hypothetical protein [Komagataeibacter xylinus]|uniref:glycine-rich domain-containing protein n=1 Tax=Komagataeibacter xylinus TaxID=28448 RepID=UPI001F5F2D9A|nr:hypothetical protein [Komagataeibacter xylinus]
MDLIIGTGTVAEASRDTMPATGTPGWATDGNPAATIPATDFPAAHYNMLMAEVIQPILDAGLTLDPANWGQLSAAIKALAKQAASGAVLGSPGVLATGDVAGAVLYYSAALAAPAFTYGSTTVGLATTTALTSALGDYLPLGGGNVTGAMDWGLKTAANTVTHRFWSAGAPTTGNATPDATLTATGGTPGTANAGTLALETGTLDLSGVKSTLLPDATLPQQPVVFGQLAGLTPGRLLNTQVFDTAGTYPYTPTPGTTRIEVDIQGGGGSGGYAYGTSSAYVSCSTAGGAGSFCRAAYKISDIQADITAGLNITVGAAGAVSPLNESGGNGGASSFGSLATAPGGYGGKYGVAANENAYFQFALGTPGDAPTGTGIVFSVRGGPADMQFDLGGGIMSGQGGSSLFGTGGGPISAGGAYGVANVTAQNGNGPGAGGSGLPAGVSATGGPGGLGVDGIAIIREFA